MARTCLALAAAVLMAGATAAMGDAPVGWRGDGTGQYPTATPVTEWSAQTNVVWKTPMPAWSNASPVIVGERIFVCAEPATLLCINKADGKILWQKVCDYNSLLAAGEKAKAPAWSPPPAHEVNGYTSATPVSDGKSVYVVFGTGIAARYDLEGNRTWARMVERPEHGWGHSSSPVLAGDTLVVHVKKVWGLKVSDGQTAWTADSPQAWGTPVVAQIGQASVVITPGGDLIRAADGVKLASQPGKLTYAAPIVQNGLVYFAQDKACCVRLPDKAEPVAQLAPVWANEGRQKRYYASSLLHDGRLYMINQAGDFNVLDAGTGKTLSGRKLDLGGTTYPSITLGGGHVFVSSDTGVTVVLAPGDEPKQLARNTLEPFRSTPVFAGERMYVRAMGNLYCIGK